LERNGVPSVLVESMSSPRGRAHDIVCAFCNRANARRGSARAAQKINANDHEEEKSP